MATAILKNGKVFTTSNTFSLILFFRLIVSSIFQKRNYNDTLFYCPCIHAMDGFNVSLQIHNSNYANSENGYRTLGHTYKEVEFGFPSHNEPLMFEYSECYAYNSVKEAVEDNYNICKSVGIIPIEIMEKVFQKHGGINWQKTISIEHFNKFVK